MRYGRGESSGMNVGFRYSAYNELSLRHGMSEVLKPWPAARLVRLWNSLPGVTPVKRFTDRKTALNRIWQALQNRGGNSAAKSKTRRKNGARSNKATARAGTKKAHIIPLLERPNGATVAEIMRATDWQPHTVRGFISRALVHDLGLQVARFKREKGQPAYRLQR